MDRAAIAISVIHEAHQLPCPPIEPADWTPPPLFNTQNVTWRKSGKREVLAQGSSTPTPFLLGPMLCQGTDASEKKWVLTCALSVPDSHAHLAELHRAFCEWLLPHYDGQCLFMSRWKSNFNGHPRPGIRWWHAEDGKFVQRDGPTQVVMPVVEKFTRVDGRVFIELGMDVVCC